MVEWLFSGRSVSDGWMCGATGCSGVPSSTLIHRYCGSSILFRVAYSSTLLFECYPILKRKTKCWLFKAGTREFRTDPEDFTSKLWDHLLD